MNTIFTKIETSFHNNLPFVAYRKPNLDEVSGLFFKDETLYHTSNFTEEGFVFAPFDSTEKSILFPLDNATSIKEELNLTPKEFISTLKTDFTDSIAHNAIVEDTIAAINTTELIKVVISRKETIGLDSFDLVTLFKRLLLKYQNAFVYVWFHPKVGLWFGATPETLLQVKQNSFKTMSLAGTQVHKKSNNVVWQKKELEEQQLVTDFIQDQLEGIGENLKINKTETVKAGNLLHLKTKVTGSLAINASLKELIRALHPTPAVCGLPRAQAKTFIKNHELYKRTFYTGFLGEINNNKETALFVNLRCMQIENNTAEIYIGGGITKDSNAKKEWEETVAKSNTMKAVL